MARSEIPKATRAVPKARNDHRIEKSSDAGRVTRNATKKLQDLATHNKQSPLLRLSAELRNKIYEYSIGGNEIWAMHDYPDSDYFDLTCSPYNSTGDTRKAWEDLFSLSLVSRQLRTETKLLPFQLNVFNIPLGAEFGQFLSQLKDVYKRAITTVSFGYKVWNNLPIFMHEDTVPGRLDDCTGLTTVISVVTLHDTQKRIVKKFAEDRGLKLLIETEGITDAGGSYCLGDEYEDPDNVLEE